MRILVLGGTVFLGRHVVDAAQARGHELTLYSRGRHGTVPDGVEHVTGDRADVTPLQGREWDAAIDTSGYDPAHVEASTRLERRPLRVRLDLQRLPGVGRRAGRRGLARLAGRRGLRAGQGRGRARRAARTAPTVRAGLIVGPHDNVFRLPWWVRRIAQGGVVPAPGRPDLPVQVIDARDLAAFLLDLAEQRVTRRLQRHRADRADDDGRAALVRGRRRAALDRRRGARGSSRSSPGSSCRCGCPEGYAWQVGTDKAQAAGPALPPGRRDRRRRRRLAARRRRGRAGRLALRAPPAADERRTRGRAAQSSVSPTQPPGVAPGGTAHRPEPTCLMYSLSPSARPSRRLQRRRTPPGRA